MWQNKLIGTKLLIMPRVWNRQEASVCPTDKVEE